MVILGGTHADSKGQSSSIGTEEGKRFDSALFATLDALEEEKVDYVLIGGIAASGLGRPRSTQDIDLFVRPEDAEALITVFENHGFTTNRFNPTWIYKAYKDNVLIDIIFRSEGGFYFDEEMQKHAKIIEYHGRQVRVVGPEDFVLIKCAVHSEEGHHHWHDALAVLAQSKLDWDYLIHRSRKAPRRLLALLLYAQSCDIWIPNSSIQKIFENIFEYPVFKKDGHDKEKFMSSAHGARPQVKSEMGDTYLAAKIREALITNPNIGGLGIEVRLQDEHILLRGLIASEEQRKTIHQLIHEMSANHKIEDQLQINDWKGASDVEALQ